MKKRSIQDLEIRGLAIDLVCLLWNNEYLSQKSASLLHQEMIKIAMNVPNFLAQGHERYSKTGFTTNLYHAKGSLAQLISMLHILNHTTDIDEQRFHDYEQKITTLQIKIQNLLTYLRKKQKEETTSTVIASDSSVIASETKQSNSEAKQSDWQA